MLIGIVVGMDDPIKSIEVVRSLHFTSCQLYAPFSDDWYTDEGVKKIREAAESKNVQITSLICAFPGEDYSSLESIKKTVGIVNPQTREERVERILSIADLAFKLDVKVVQGHLGFIPERDTPAYNLLIENVRRIADRIEKNGGQVLALETGQESALEMLQFIKDLGRNNVKVNFDPANFLIYDSDKPLEALEVLKDLVIGVHCKDALRPSEKGQLGIEVPLGEGEVDIHTLIERLKEYGYTGILAIEREVGDEEKWIKDVIKAKKLLESLI